MRKVVAEIAAVIYDSVIEQRNTQGDEMKPADFLKLIGAPWAAYHDHPDEETRKDLASIRSKKPGSPRYVAEVCGVYLCDYDGQVGQSQRARRDLIVQAPRMYQYIASMASVGDTEAKMILREIHHDE